MPRHGPGRFLVNEVVEECQRAVVTKLLEPTRKALTQLYSTAVPTDYRRSLSFVGSPPTKFSRLEKRIPSEQLCRTTCSRLSVSSFPTSLSQFCMPENSLKIHRGLTGNSVCRLETCV